MRLCGAPEYEAGPGYSKCGSSRAQERVRVFRAFASRIAVSCILRFMMDANNLFDTSSQPGVPPETPPASSVGSKRPLSADHNGTTTENRRKDPKSSRACDWCKKKKIRCNGTLPCNNCTRRALTCEYAAKYGRGRPPTPPPAPTQMSSRQHCRSAENTQHLNGGSYITSVSNDFSAPESQHQATPEAEDDSQYFDTTSGLNFLHRAWKKWFVHGEDVVKYGFNQSERNQPLTSAGDRPFCVEGDKPDSITLPDAPMCWNLLSFYFDNCVVTYRMFHRKTTENWMQILLKNREHGQTITRSLGHSRCAILLNILAIATLRWDKVNSELSAEGEAAVLKQSDQLFCTAVNLTDTEAGFPRLESAQARLIQVLYLLQTSRMNKGWYTFGSAFHVTLSLGMHRRRDQRRDLPIARDHSDYISLQCCKRTFWVAYIIDRYLSVVFGRPRLYQDEDIDQDFPDQINDEDMTPQGPSLPEEPDDCYIDGLIMHARY